MTVGDASQLTSTLADLAQTMASTATEALARLSNQPIRCGQVRVGTAHRDEVLANGSVAILSAGVGGLDDSGCEHTIRIVMPARDAKALCSYMMMKPESVIAQARASDAIDDQVRHLLQDLSSVVCSALIGKLRRGLGLQVDLKCSEQDFVATTTPPNRLLPDEQLAEAGFSVAVADYPEAGWRLLLQHGLAEASNGAASDAPAPPVPTAALHTYLCGRDIVGALEQACRDLHLELTTYRAADVPDPALHSGDLVLVEVPPGHQDRFEWCQLLKSRGDNTRVALILHQPTRARVLQAFETGADTIVGVPVDTGTLINKLRPLRP